MTNNHIHRAWVLGIKFHPTHLSTILPFSLPLTTLIPDRDKQTDKQTQKQKSLIHRATKAKLGERRNE